jgi:hypothetical protein
MGDEQVFGTVPDIFAILKQLNAVTGVRSASLLKFSAGATSDELLEFTKDER